MSQTKRPSGNHTKTTAAGRPAGQVGQNRKPAQNHRKPAKKQSAFDLETLVALLLVVLIIAGATIGIVVMVNNSQKDDKTSSRSASGTAPKATMSVNADIRPEATPEPEPTPAADDGSTETYIEPQETQQVQAAVQQTIPQGQLRSARIRTVGDFVIADTIYNYAKKLGTETKQSEYDFIPMLSYISSTMANADYTVANVDGCLGGKECYKYGYSSYPQFNTPPHLLFALKNAGVDMLTLANNHMLDGWFDGLQKTIANVEAVGINHIGANRSLEEKNTPVIIEVNGIKIGMLNYTESLNSMDTQKSLDKRAMEYGVNAIKNSSIASDVQKARSMGADVIVCFMHWGTEYQDAPDKNQESYANLLVKAGVDVIMGNHPHCVQPARWLSGTNQFGEAQKTLCVYSIGNFLSAHRQEALSGGVIFDFTIQEMADGSFEIVSPGYLPTWVWCTGSGKDFTYQVVPSGTYLSTRPAGMSDSDYKAMLANYNHSVGVMQQGVGNLITE